MPDTRRVETASDAPYREPSDSSLIAEMRKLQAEKYDLQRKLEDASRVAPAMRGNRAALAWGAFVFVVVMFTGIAATITAAFHGRSELAAGMGAIATAGLIGFACMIATLGGC